MDYAERIKLEQAVKDVTLVALNELIAHNFKGADLIKRGLEQALNIKDEIEAHYDQLKLILNMLKPVFDIARDWIKACYVHLLDLFDWAKAKWHEIFG